MLQVLMETATKLQNYISKYIILHLSGKKIVVTSFTMWKYHTHSQSILLMTKSDYKNICEVVYTKIDLPMEVDIFIQRFI